MLRSRDDRRRRALAEEGARDELEPTEISTRAAEPALYAAKASDLADLRLRDLIPRQRRYLVAWGALLAVVNGLILAGQCYHEQICTALGTDRVAALDPSQPANLATWLIAVSTAGAACCAGLIYAWRRLRLDDYRGSYRWWLAATVFLAVISIATVAPLHQLWQLLMIRLTGWSSWEQGAVWWIGPGLLMGLSIALRLAMELTRARTAMALFLLGSVLLCGALVVQGGVFQFEAEAAAVANYGCQMLAGSAFLLGFLCYARHVLLEIDGVIKPTKRVPGEAKRGRKRVTRGEQTLLIDEGHKATASATDKSSDAGSPTVKPATAKAPPVISPAMNSGAVPKPHAFGFNTNPQPSRGAPEPVKSAVPSQPAAKFDHDNDNDVDDRSSGGKTKLSRAERKRLRKQQRGQYDDEE